MLLPREAIEVLRHARWDPSADREYEIMAGGFVWSDERLAQASRICFDQGNWAFRHLVAYRTSLILAEPREEFAEPWNQLLEECPDWPGFRPERASTALALELQEVSEQRAAELDDLDRRLRSSR